MDKNSEYFLSLLAAFIKETVPKEPANINWEKVYALAHIHGVSGALYLTVQKIDKDKGPTQSTLKKLKADFFATMLRYEQQEKAYQEITKKLSNEKIEHIFFKGAVIREYYLVKQMRTLGDIDFLLHEKDQRVVSKALLEIGYKKYKVSTRHVEYKKGNVHIEAHGKMMNDEINEKADYISYFQNVWENSCKIDNSYRYNINIEYHLLYLLTHIAKHFYDCGAGVRMILDIAVIINKFGASIDFDYLWKELEKLKLDAFARNIFELCIRYFEVYVPNIKIQLDDKAFDMISNYILEGGTFGFNNRNLAICNIRQEYDKTADHKRAKIKAFWKKIFLNYKEMINTYYILKKLPFLLPFLWIVRVFQCIITKPKKTLSILKGLFYCTDKAEESYSVIKKMGLSKRLSDF